MRLTTYTDYALRVLMHVALQNGELVRVADIASGYRISRNHLTKVVHKLGKLSLLSTVQGRSGGMYLARPADEINVGEVVRAFEPDFRLVECFDAGESDCRIQPACALRGAFGEALERFLQHLDSVSLADLVQPGKELRTLLGFPVHVTSVQSQ